MEDALIFAAGLLAGFFGSTVGGGGMIIVPALILVGLTPQEAVAVTKCGSLGSGLSSLFKYSQAGEVKWRWVLPLSILSGSCSFLGANLLLEVDTKTVVLVIGGISLFLLPVILFKSDLETAKRKVSPHFKVRAVYTQAKINCGR